MSGFFDIHEFTAREISIGIWSTGFLACSLLRSEVRSSAWAVLKSLFGPAQIRYVFFGAGLYVVTLVMLLQAIGYWTPEYLKDTVFWFFGASCLQALFSISKIDRGYFRSLVYSNFAFGAFAEYALNQYTFSLILELLLVPVAAFLVICRTLASTLPEFKDVAKFDQTRIVLSGALALIWLLATANSLVQAGSHVREFGSMESVRDFFLPFVLSLGFVPYLYSIRLYSTLENSLMIAQITFVDRSLYDFSKRAVLRACGLSLRRARFFQERFSKELYNVECEADVVRLISDFNTEWSVRDRTPIA